MVILVIEKFEYETKRFLLEVIREDEFESSMVPPQTFENVVN